MCTVAEGKDARARWSSSVSGSVMTHRPSVCLCQDYAFSSVRVETPLLLVVNGKPQGSSSQAAATVASRPQCE